MIALAALLRAREGLPDISASSASVSGAVSGALSATMPVAMPVVMPVAMPAEARILP